MVDKKELFDTEYDLNKIHIEKFVKPVELWTVRVVLEDGAYMPEKAHEADAGFDLRTPKKFTLFPFMRKHIDTGVHVLLPAELVGRVSPKSGLAKKYGIDTDGVVDGEYTGTIGVTILNRGWRIKRFRKGDKIAQLVISENPRVDFIVSEDIPDTERGDNGFGSTGR